MSAGLPQLHPIAFGISDPAESADTLHVLGLLNHVCSMRAELRKHRIKVADTEVEHRLLRAGAEVFGLGLERREDRHPGSLTPKAVLVGVQAQAIAIPRTQGYRVNRAQKISANAKHTFHMATLPVPRSPRPDGLGYQNGGRPHLDRAALTTTRHKHAFD
jgi:hypothetical protein